MDDVAALTEAAEAGQADAQLELGNFYSSQAGAGTQPERAVYWYRRAALQRMPEAMYNLSVCYLTGFGVSHSLAKSRKWAQLCEHAISGDLSPLLPAP